MSPKKAGTKKKTPAKKSAKKPDSKVKVKVKPNCYLKYNGRLYRTGSIIEMISNEANKLKDKIIIL